MKSKKFDIFYVSLIRVLQSATPFLLLLALEQTNDSNKFVSWHRYGLIVSLFGLFDLGVSNIILVGTRDWRKSNFEVLRLIYTRSILGLVISLIIVFLFYGWSLWSSIIFVFASCFAFVSKLISNIFIGLSNYKYLLLLLFLATITKIIIIFFISEPILLVGLVDFIFSVYCLNLVSNDSFPERSTINFFEKKMLFWIALSSSASLFLGFAERMLIEANNSEGLFVHLSFIITFFSVFSIVSAIFSTLILKGLVLNIGTADLFYYISLAFVLFIIVYFGFPLARVLFPHQMQLFNYKITMRFGLYYFFLATLSPVHSRYTVVGKTFPHVVITIIASFLFISAAYFNNSFLDFISIVGLIYSTFYLVYDFCNNAQKSSLIIILLNCFIYVIVNYCSY